MAASIVGIATYLPEKKLRNSDLALEFQDWNAEKILEKTGIETRGLAAGSECASDLGIKAAQKLFQSGKFNRSTIDFLLFCTQSPDYFLPTTACKIHKALHLPSTCGALDYNLGCSGFVYGLSLAKGLIAGNIAKNVLLITAETYSKYIHPKDKSVRTIFSDGAAATLIQSSVENEIGTFVLGTDGVGEKNLIVPTGGHRKPKTPTTATEIIDSSGNIRSEDNLYMCGPEIFNFTISSVPPLIDAVLEKNNLTKETINYIIFHQANRYMLEHLRKKCGIPKEKFCINLKDYGNTVSSTIPMAIERALFDKSIKHSDTIALVGFGVGYSWAGVTIKINKEIVFG